LSSSLAFSDTGKTNYRRTLSTAIAILSRAVSAPLNPAYSISEFQFYLQDTKPALLLIPPLQGGANKAAQTALEAGKKENIPVFEIWIDDGIIKINKVFGNKYSGTKKTVAEVGDPQPEDIALVLHTSGTTGRYVSQVLCYS
jgi:long-subunit acyl-CoA synthetase (AMP-forming)